MMFILIAEGFPGPVMIPIAMIRNGTEASYVSLECVITFMQYFLL